MFLWGYDGSWAGAILFFSLSISDIYPATPNMVYAVSRFWGGQRKCVLGEKFGLMRCHPNSFFSFFLSCCLIFLCFSRITWAMEYSIFFNERKFLFRFLLLPRVHRNASNFIASGRVIRLLIFFLSVLGRHNLVGDKKYCFFSLHSGFRTLRPAPFPFLLVDHDEVGAVHFFLGNIIGLGLVASDLIALFSLGCIGAGFLSSTE